MKTKGIVNKSLDDVEVTKDRIRIIDEKYILKKIYEERYRFFLKNLSGGNEAKTVEIGSGAGFIKEIIPNAITSELLKLPNVDMHFSALDMPFEDESVDNFLMIDVLHHIPDIYKLFSEINRCLKKGGKLIFTEPANTLWSRFIYQNFHHETFNPKADWTFVSQGPLSDANGALPYIVFERDINKFNELYPNFKITYFKKHSPIKYLISGGFTMKQLLPNFMFPVVNVFEKVVTPLNSLFGMFETIIIQKNELPIPI
ncbi:MAG: class I SAM-dependent methyltransferase [bacterium]